MTAMEVMERCRSANAERRAVENRIQRYRDSATRITSAIGGVGGRGTSEPDKLTTIMGEIDALERRVAQRNREYAAEVAAANRLLDSLPETEARVLSLYYIRGMTLSAVARELTYSYGYIRAVKGSGCRILGSVPEGDVRQLLPAWYGRIEEAKDDA